MKFTLSWLKDHLETEASLEEICERLTAIGLEVEDVDDKAAYKPFVIAKILTAEKHPEADRLKVLTVDAGDGKPVQIVCGAPNARVGMIGALARPGTYVPGIDVTLSVGKIRGVESHGMMCSEKELNISDDHNGIIDLPEDAPVGTSFASYAGLDDPVIEINLTPNRPDCTSVFGIARDLAASGLGTLKAPKAPAFKVEGETPHQVKLELEDHLCPGFAYRLVRGVKNGPSPKWMQQRLLSIGLRPISALVDVTNYMTFDQGRPMHVFDADKVKGALVVRRAKEGEEILALDTRTYKLNPANVIIADDNGPESIGGIMGGEHSGCDENTVNVLIESALWDPINIAKTGRAHGIITDARYRFERGIDPAFCVPGAELATHLVMDLCGGEPSELIVAGEVPNPVNRIEFPLGEVERLTGLELPREEKIETLQKLGFTVEGTGNNVAVTVPTWRPDVEGKADLVEEVVRIAGVDRVASVPLARMEATVAKPILTVLQRRTSQARRALAAQGLVEAVNWSFISKDRAEMFGGGKPELALANPIASDLSDMRPSLMPGLVAAVGRNADRGYRDVGLFEVGQIFLGAGERDQRQAAAAVRSGTAKLAGSGRHWAGASNSIDVFDAKTDAMAMLGALGVAAQGMAVVPGGPSWLHPGRSGTLQFGPKNIIGHFGELHPAVLEAFDIDVPVCGFEIILDAVPAPRAKPNKVKPKLDMSEFMALERDFAFIVDRSVNAADILRAAQSAERSLLAGVNVFDIYEGTGIPEGKKSVAISVTLQPREKTLTDAEIEAVAGKIVAEVTKKTGATLRG